MDVDLSQDGSTSSVDNSNDLRTTPESSATLQGERDSIANTIAELDKMEKFKFEGQEYTPKALKEAILRMQDYSRKTASLSEERKSFEQERKFYDNLYADLEHVRKNPTLASEFIKLYPEKFHQALKQVLNESGSQTPQPQNAQRPQIDVDLLARLNRLESSYMEQEVAKNTQAINTTIEKFSKQYPEANTEVVIARIYESYNQGAKPTEATWEEAFKASQQQEEARFKAKYGEFVKKQSQANTKARDVDAGGGTPGRAPKQFKSLKEVTEHAANSLSQG